MTSVPRPQRLTGIMADVPESPARRPRPPSPSGSATTSNAAGHTSASPSCASAAGRYHLYRKVGHDLDAVLTLPERLVASYRPVLEHIAPGGPAAAKERAALASARKAVEARAGSGAVQGH